MSQPQSIEAGVRITGLKNVTFDEPFFGKHTGGARIMPGLLVIEAMAQTGAVEHAVNRVASGRRR